MKCPKCSNLMVPEDFTDYQQTGRSTFTGWRCLSCGLILDPVIIDHLARHQEEQHQPDLKKTFAGAGR